MTGPGGQPSLAFLVLAHDGAAQLIELIETLTSDGDTVAVHFDARGSDRDFAEVRARFDGRADILFARREACGWGDFSLVRATLNGIEALRATGRGFDYAYLLSGADLPLKSIRSLKAYLAGQLPDGAEFIESVPLDRGKWVKGGLERERFIYRHIFNERRNPQLFGMFWKAQRALGLEVRPPRDIRIALGSQWWCLTWKTCLSVVDFVAARPDVIRYFARTWIPDESFFQSIVRAVVPEDRIRNLTLTFYQFTDYGKPYVFFDEHANFLLRLNRFFGRKVAYSAVELRRRLHAIGRNADVAPVDPERAIAPILELDARRLTQRFPSRTRRTIGEFIEPRVADVPFTGKFLLLNLLPADLTTYSGLAAGTRQGDGWIMHGHLFNPERIRFADDAEMYGGYSARDTAAARELPGVFLANIMAAGPDVTIYSASWVEGLEPATDLQTAENVLTLVTLDLPISSLVTAQLIDRTLGMARERLPGEEEVLQAEQEIGVALAALRRLLDSTLDLPNFQDASSHAGLVQHVRSIDPASSKMIGEAVSAARLLNRQAANRLLKSELGRHVAAVLKKAGRGQVMSRPHRKSPNLAGRRRQSRRPVRTRPLAHL